MSPLKRLESFKQFAERTDLRRLPPESWKLQTVKIKLTERCNYRCPKCKCSTWRGTSRLKPIRVRQFIDKVRNLGVRNVRLTGGEFVLYKHLREVLDHCSQAGVSVGVTTNGSLLPANAWILEHDALAHVSISIDSFAREQYEGRTGVPGSYQFLLRTLPVLFEARRRRGFMVVCQVVLDDSFPARVPSFEALFREFAFDAVSLMPFANVAGREQPGEPDRSAPYRERMRAHVRAMADTARPAGVDVWSMGCEAELPEDTSFPCARSFLNLLVSPVGAIHPCCTQFAVGEPLCTLGEFVRAPGDSLPQAILDWRRRAVHWDELPCARFCAGADLALALKTMHYRDRAEDDGEGNESDH